MTPKQRVQDRFPLAFARYDHRELDWCIVSDPVKGFVLGIGNNATAAWRMAAKGYCDAGL